MVRARRLRIDIAMARAMMKATVDKNIVCFGDVVVATEYIGPCIETE